MQKVPEKIFVEKFADAIKHEEGYYKKQRIPTVAQRCNNPGNLTHWKDSAGDSYPEANGYVVFPDPETGNRALMSQCRINIFKRGLTFREFFAGKPGVYKGFAPRDDSRHMQVQKNDPVLYAQRVLQRVCVPFGIEATIDTPIVTLIELMNRPPAQFPRKRVTPGQPGPVQKAA